MISLRPLVSLKGIELATLKKMVDSHTHADIAPVKVIIDLLSLTEVTINNIVISNDVLTVDTFDYAVLIVAAIAISENSPNALHNLLESHVPDNTIRSTVKYLYHEGPNKIPRDVLALCDCFLGYIDHEKFKYSKYVYHEINNVIFMGEIYGVEEAVKNLEVRNLILKNGRGFLLRDPYMGEECKNNILIA